MGGELPVYIGIEVEENRAGEAMRKALLELKAESRSDGEEGGGSGEYWRDLRDLERIVQGWVD